MLLCIGPATPSYFSSPASGVCMCGQSSEGNFIACLSLCVPSIRLLHQYLGLLRMKPTCRHWHWAIHRDPENVRNRSHNLNRRIRTEKQNTPVNSFITPCYRVMI